MYDGEDEKIRDWNSSLPLSLINQVIAPAVASGRNVVVLGEEWHTASSMNLISDSLYYRGLRDRVVMLWNANNTFGFDRINWGALAFATTMTTVSRYMKFKMWESGQNPMVIPNGIPRSSIHDADPAAVAEIRLGRRRRPPLLQDRPLRPGQAMADGGVGGRLSQAARRAREAGDARRARAARRRGALARRAPGPDAGRA